MIVAWLSMALAGASPSLVSDPGLRPGAYRMVVDVASRSEVAFAGTTEVVTRSLLRVDVRATADGLVQEQRVCDVRILSDSRARTEIPAAFVRSLPVQTYPITVRRGVDGVVRYEADPGPSEVGFDPAISGGPVPGGRNDPGVTDPDGDGHPGVTVHLVVPVIGQARIYIAQRGHSRYAGQVDRGEVRGAVEVVAMEQRTLGASFAPFAANPTLTSVPERSRFRMVPVDAGSGCAALVGSWDEGF
jgi:hypothetical protein